MDIKIHLDSIKQIRLVISNIQYLDKKVQFIRITKPNSEQLANAEEELFQEKEWYKSLISELVKLPC